MPHFIMSAEVHYNRPTNGVVIIMNRGIKYRLYNVLQLYHFNMQLIASCIAYWSAREHVNVIAKTIGLSRFHTSIAYMSQAQMRASTH